MITVVMTTYVPQGKIERAQYASSTAYALFAHLHCKYDKLRLLIADDGSMNVDFTYNILSEANFCWGFNGNQVITGSHIGIGGSLNRALTLVDGPWMYVTDDWVLTEDLDLTWAVKLLDYGYDMVKLGPTHPNLRCTTKFRLDIGWWLDVDPTYGFAFATRPFLARKSLIEKVGLFDEFLNAYIVEQNYAERVAKTPNVSIAQLGTINLAGPWLHIGEIEVGNDFKI